MNKESIIYETKTHWIVFLLPLLSLCIGVYYHLVSHVFLLSTVAYFWTVLFFLRALISFFFSSYILTDDYVILKSGLVHRKTNEILLKKMEGLQFEESILGRFLNYGSIIVGGTGGTKDIHKHISNPKELKNRIQTLLK